MLKISQIKTTNLNTVQSVKTNFKGVPGNGLSVDFILTPKAVELIKRADTLIEETWIKIKKGQTHMMRPDFLRKYRKETTAALKPVYNTRNDSLMLEISNPEYIDRIIVERGNPNAFLYEKAIKTKAGSATTKTYNNKLGNDPEMNKKISAYIEEYLPLFVGESKKAKNHIK